MFVSYVCNSFGCFQLVSDGKFLLEVSYMKEKGLENSCFLLEQTKKELEEYFLGTRTKFDIPIFFDGTVFQVKVWNALKNIPYGSIVSYQDIAKMIGKPKAVRAVGGAIHKNPIMIIVPCHRVIGKNGNLVGFAYGLDLKQRLLDLEQNTFF